MNTSCSSGARAPHVARRRARRFVVVLSLLSAASPLTAQSTIHAGVVRATETRQPLAGVTVRTATAHTLSDSLGRFSIRVAGDSTPVYFERLGYASRSYPAYAVPGEVLLVLRPTTLDVITVTSTDPLELSRGSALGSVGVSGADIAARAGTSLAERLGGVEGVSVQRMGEWGSRALVRGLGGERLTIMIDGARVNRACTFGMDKGSRPSTPPPWSASRCFRGRDPRCTARATWGG